MNKLIVIITLALGAIALPGCSLFDGSDQSTEQTSSSLTLCADKTDIINSNYTLKVRKDMNLVDGQLTFTNNKMEWIRTYKANENDTSNNSEKKRILNDVKISTKKDIYVVTGTEDGKEISLQFTKIGNYRLEDNDGNIYSL